MVKPPKTMQPEQVDLSKAGRASGKSFKENSFHEYMARKISLQRQQFGLQLPPPPTDDEKPPAVLQEDVSPRNQEPSDAKLPATPLSPRFEPLPHTAQPKKLLLKKKRKLDADNTKEEQGNKKQKGKIRFDKGTKPPFIGPKRKVPGNSSMRRVLKRLRRKHGLSKSMQQRMNRGNEREATEEIGDNTNDNTWQNSASTQEEENSFDDFLASGPKFDDDDDDCVTDQDASQSETATESPRMLQDLDDGPLTTRNVVGYRAPKSFASATVSIDAANDSDNIITSPLLLKQQRPDLFFYGVVIKTQGYTDPDEATLRRLIQKHGGDYETYETSRTTHLIAQSLSTARQNVLKNQRRPIPVCKPSWIVDSVKAGKLLPQGQYLLQSDESQKISMFTPQKKDIFQPSEQQSKADSKTEPPETSPKKRASSGKQRNNDGSIRNVSTDPNFVKTYFETSRLSFIGSFRMRNKASGENVADNAAAEGKPKFIFYVDMDEFFCSVVLRKFPEHRDKPVAISHNAGTGGGKGAKRSTSECATVNYIARKYGLRKGMFLGSARELCPHLVVLKYDFDGYEEVTAQVTEILHTFAADPTHPGMCIPISCDEFVLEIAIMEPQEDISGYLSMLAEKLRKDIFDTTQCTASVGVGENKFLAKMACGKNKPDGSFVVQDYRPLVQGLTLSDLPGVGWKGNRKLKEEGLVTVKDILQLGDDGEKRLCDVLGPGNGGKIYQFCIGKDPRQLSEVKQKSVSAECNYGVRFDGTLGIDHFMMELSKELEKRLTLVGTRGSKVTLKLKKRKSNAKEPPKFLGHGSCHNLSKSVELPSTTRDASLIFKSGMSLLKQMPIESVHDVRGMGITMSNLTEDGEQPKPTVAGLKHWLENTSSPVKAKDPKETQQAQKDGHDSDDSDEFDSLDDIAKIRPFEEENAAEETVPVGGAETWKDADDSSESESESDDEFDPALLPPIVEKIDTYTDDIVPLLGFLQENDSSDEEARQRVSEFLAIVTRERPASLKPLIRKVGQLWPDVVEGIVHNLAEVCHEAHGYHLDTNWILGKPDSPHVTRQGK